MSFNRLEAESYDNFCTDFYKTSFIHPQKTYVSFVVHNPGKLSKGEKPATL